MTRRMSLRTYLRWIESHPHVSYHLAIMGLGVPVLSTYLWIAELW